MSQRCKNLILDSGPLLSLSPLRGLADNYLTVPQVLDELKDKRAREHFERLGLSTGVRVSIRNPEPASLAQVIQFAKRTGDYPVLSHADLCVLALTHTIQLEEDASLQEQKQKLNCSGIGEITQSSVEAAIVDNVRSSASASRPDLGSNPSLSPLVHSQATEEEDIGDLSRAAKYSAINSRSNCSLPENQPHSMEASQSSGSGNDSCTSTEPTTEMPLYDEPSTDEDDGEGEWITPDNAALHKSRVLELLPSLGDDTKTQRRVDDEPFLAGCMTTDFAMQNVLLQMGLALVGIGGGRIRKVKTWVLRCHACFKICKDNSKQFCPSCGNPTLLRASVTLSSPNTTAGTPAMELHLKKNFQFKLRGTKYSIPAPRPGSAKTGPGEGLILREDQLEYMRAKKRADGRKGREEQRMLKGLIDQGGDRGIAVGSWSDPDWIPGIYGNSGKGKPEATDGMPQIGYGRRNPNERRKH